MKEETKIKIILFFVCCIPGIIMISIMAFIPHDVETGFVLSILTFIALSIPLMYILCLGHAYEYQEQQKQMLKENEKYYQKMKNL